MYSCQIKRHHTPPCVRTAWRKKRSTKKNLMSVSLRSNLFFSLDRTVTHTRASNRTHSFLGCCRRWNLLRCFVFTFSNGFTLLFRIFRGNRFSSACFRLKKMTTTTTTATKLSNYMIKSRRGESIVGSFVWIK